MVTYRIAEVYFSCMVPLPQGHPAGTMGQSLFEVPGRCEITREGDTLIVRFVDPNAVARGFDASAEYLYSWNCVTRAVRVPEPKAAVPVKLAK